MNGFWSSVSSWWNEKTSSPLYFTYLVFFIVWNWRFFQIIFLEDGALFASPRLEYIQSNLFFSVPFSTSTPVLVGILLEGMINFCWHIGPPALLTFFAIKYLPILHKLAFDIHIKNYFARRDAYRSADLVYQKGETARLTEEATEKALQYKQKTKIERIEKAKTQEEKWSEDFEDFKKTSLFDNFKQIVHSVYKNSGRTWWGNEIMDSNIKAFADARGLIIISANKNNGGDMVSLTDKGKYFVAKFLADHPLE